MPDELQSEIDAEWKQRTKIALNGFKSVFSGNLNNRRISSNLYLVRFSWQFEVMATRHIHTYLGMNIRSEYAGKNKSLINTHISVNDLIFHSYASFFVVVVFQQKWTERSILILILMVRYFHQLMLKMRGEWKKINDFFFFLPCCKSFNFCFQYIFFFCFRWAHVCDIDKKNAYIRLEAVKSRKKPTPRRGYFYCFRCSKNQTKYQS